MRKRLREFPKHMDWAHRMHAGHSVEVFTEFLCNIYFRHCRIGRITLKEQA